MAYALKYELECTSRLSNLYKLQLLFDGYAGSEISRDVPASPFHLRKDKAGVIKGTSLQFSIREEVDFEFFEFYTNNAKYIKAVLYKSSTVIWSGYVAPQQYQAPYIPASRKPSITFTATDGLGLLKNEDFTLTGSQDQLAIIRHCLDKIALNLGYSIAIDLYETTHNETYPPLAQTYEDASNYTDYNCYQVLEKILGKYNAEISQVNNRWRVVCDNDKKSAPKLYTYAGVYESAGSAPSVLDLGYPDVSGVEVWPVGYLNQALQAGGKSVNISQDFGLKPSFLDNYNFLNYSAGAFEGWTKSGSFDVLQKWLDGKPYAFLDGYSNVYTDYIQQSIQLVNTSGNDFIVEFEFAPIARVVHAPGDITGIVDTSVEVLIYIWDGGTGFRYLTKKGWRSDFGHLETIVVSSISQPTWNKVRVFTSELPFASCTLFVRLFRLHSSGPLENQTLTGLAYSNICAYPLHVNESYPGKSEVTALFDNSTESLKLSDVDVFTADAPYYDNAKLLYKFITKLSSGAVTTLWHRYGSGTEYSLVVQLARMLASNNRVARQKLTGTIKGDNISFDSLIKHAYNNNREFEISECSWDLYEEKWSVTLLEILAWSNEDITFTSGYSQGKSASMGSSGVNITGTGIENDFVSALSGADILAKLVNVDGSGSLLDADLLDGQHGSYYAPIASPSFTGTVTLPLTTIIPDGGSIGQTAGPLLTFDDTNNYLEITGAAVIVGGTAPTNSRALTVLNAGGFAGIYSEGTLQMPAGVNIYMTSGPLNDTGVRMKQTVSASHVYYDYYEDLHFRSGVGSSADTIIFKSTGAAGFGTIAPNAKIESLATTEQLRLSYDATHYTSFTVGSTGAIKIKPVDGAGVEIWVNGTGDFNLRSGFYLHNLHYDSSARSFGVNCLPVNANFEVDGTMYISGDAELNADNKHKDFTAGFGGTNWSIASSGNAEFGNMLIRGGLSVYELIINRMHYQNGGLIIGPGAGKIGENSLVGGGVGTEQVIFEDPNGAAIVPVAAHSIILIQNVDINRSTVVKKIVREVDTIVGTTVTFKATAGWNPAVDDVGIMEAGDEACVIGDTTTASLQNSIFMTATETNNPYLAVFTEVDSYSDWLSNSRLKVMVGNLAKIASATYGDLTLPASPGYGFFSDNCYLSGKIVATSGLIGGFTIDSTAGIYSGTGATRVQMKPGEGIWCGATAIGDAPFSVTEDGDLKATGVAEIGTKTATYDSKDSNIAIKNADIWENAYNDSGSAIHINRVGYNGGVTKYRDVAIYNGKGVQIFGINGVYALTTVDNFKVIGGATIMDGVIHLVPREGPPSPPLEGQIYADTDHHLYYYNDSTWKQLDN